MKERYLVFIVSSLAFLCACDDAPDEGVYAGADFVGRYEAATFMFVTFEQSLCVEWDALKDGGFFRMELHEDASVTAEYDTACRRGACAYSIDGSYSVDADTVTMRLPEGATGPCDAGTMFRESKWLLRPGGIRNVAACAPCGGPTIDLAKQ